MAAGEGVVKSLNSDYRAFPSSEKKYVIFIAMGKFVIKKLNAIYVLY